MEKRHVLFSGYGAEGREDIVLYEVTGDGAARRLSGVRHGRAPSFCCRGMDGRIYAVSERADGADITMYELLGETLRAVRAMKTPGKGLCHLYAHGGVVYGSCFESGDFFAVDAALTQVLWQFHPGEGAYAHWTQADGEFLWMADLGRDSVYRVHLDGWLPDGEPERFPQPAGSGPRQILALGNGERLCVYELDDMLRTLDGEGCVQAETAASGVPGETVRNFPGGACRDVSGKIYVCNRGPNTVSAWQLSESGFQQRVEWNTGDWPRHIAALAGTELVLTACTRENAVCGSLVHGRDARETFRIALPGASCVLPL